MENNNSNQTDKVEWNLSAALIGEIANRLEIAGNHYVACSWLKCFINLKALKGRVIHCFNDKEQKRFTEIEKYLSKYLSWGFNPKSNPKESKALAQTKALFLLDKYNLELMNALEKYGYLIGKKSGSKKIL